MTDNGYFNFWVLLLGFCEDYKRVVINARHELILIWARNGNNYIVGDPETESTIELFNVQWRVPYVALIKVNKLSMLWALGNEQYLSMSFHSWELYEYSLLPNTTKHSWIIKTTTQLEKLRYIIFDLDW